MSVTVLQHFSSYCSSLYFLKMWLFNLFFLWHFTACSWQSFYYLALTYNPSFNHSKFRLCNMLQYYGTRHFCNIHHKYHHINYEECPCKANLNVVATSVQIWIYYVDYLSLCSLSYGGSSCLSAHWVECASGHRVCWQWISSKKTPVSLISFIWNWKCLWLLMLFFS